jgi:hypothetical protein
MEHTINFFNHRQIKKFDTCWVPDWPDSRLTGKLTLSTSLPIHFIGPVSRLSRSRTQRKAEYDVVALLSGPEPQRTVFEKNLVEQLHRGGFRYKLIRGLPELSDQGAMPHAFNHLSTEKMVDLLSRTRVIIARSGYSTLMDLAVVGGKAIFVPTPGQTEQEYLAQELMTARIAYSEPQKSFDLNRALEQVESYHGFESSRPDSNLLTFALNSIIDNKYQ